ncbi:MAG TPA: DUF6265 family protein [Bacteroidales bacterium]|nr:DUF6265 family protein [Bacteroidales bacterium]HRX96554.1 DUF6265 family protein [Bacteroidales bacterium]
MKQIILKSLLVLLTFSLVSCNNQSQHEQNAPEVLRLLPGLWYNSQLGTYEQWQISNNDYSGRAYKLNKADTIFFENLRIIKKEDTFFYEATVFDQNKGKPILFKLIVQQDNRLLFENPKHDFPQVIQYHFLNQDQMEVSIRGVEEELEKEFTFKYRKILN